MLFSSAARWIVEHIGKRWNPQRWVWLCMRDVISRKEVTRRAKAKERHATLRPGPQPCNQIAGTFQEQLARAYGENGCEKPMT